LSDLWSWALKSQAENGLTSTQVATSPSLSWNQHGSELNCNSSTGRLRLTAKVSQICIAPMLKCPTSQQKKICLQPHGK